MQGLQVVETRTLTDQASAGSQAVQILDLVKKTHMKWKVKQPQKPFLFNFEI
jgi:hypothetical protein